MADAEKVVVEQNGMTPTTLDDPKNTWKIDTVHQDEALKVLTQYVGDAEWTAQEEKKLVRKIDRKLLTLLCITYGLQYYDKAMLSHAVNSHLFLPDQTKIWLTIPGPLRTAN